MAVVLLVQTHMVYWKVLGFTASLSSVTSLTTIPTATSLIFCLPSIPDPTLVPLLKGMQKLMSFAGSFGKRFQLLLVWLLPYAWPSTINFSGTTQPNCLAEVHRVSDTKVWIREESPSAPCNTKAHKKRQHQAWLPFSI